MIKSEGFSDEEMIFGGDTTCTICHAEFLDADDLTVHVEQMHSLQQKYCQFCPTTYTDLLDYAKHIRDNHFFDLRCCRYCTKAFLDRTKLKLHEKKHLVVDNMYTCSQCVRKFPQIGLLRMHEQNNHNNDSEGCFLECMACLTSLLNLKVIALLQKEGKLLFVCATCNFTSSTLPPYKKHLKLKKCKGYVCDQCSGLYKNKKSLINHIQHAKKCMSASELETAVIKCKDCNAVVPRQAMKRHQKSCDALKCVDCGTVCKSIDDLSAHQLQEHPLDLTVIRCKFCLKEFIGESPLQKHIDRVHKPLFHLYKYKCLECNMIFKHPQKLFGHFYSKHKDLEPFNCKICKKKFRVRKAFSLHIKLDHKSVGFVEFDNQYHVFFTANKSEKPFIPECVVPKEMLEQTRDIKSKAFSVRTQELLDSDATEVDSDDDKPMKRKLPPKKTKAKRQKVATGTIEVYSSDEEPLIAVRKRALKKKGKTRWTWKWKKNQATKAQFVCNICNRICYTYQNHQNHMSQHNEDQEIECVKCSERFYTKDKLRCHMEKEHASSKLTETLKNLLIKKKLDCTSEPTTGSIAQPMKPEKFKITLTKVITEKSKVSATIKQVETDLSVKNFLENFTPEINDAPNAKIKIKSSIKITRSIGRSQKEPAIKLMKFKEEPKEYEPVSLKMPERFKHENYVKTKVTVKMVEQTYNDYILPDYEHSYSDNFQENDDDKTDVIPEVAHEISLVDTEEPSETITKIVIPKMPKGYSKIHIATLQQEAPYFKIIQVDSDNMNEIKKVETEEEREPEVNRNEVIDLPGGTKLVTANPLAHLLGGTPLNKLLEPIKKKYYKPVIKDFPGMLVQALQRLDEPPKPKKRKPKIKDTVPQES